MENNNTQIVRTLKAQLQILYDLTITVKEIDSCLESVLKNKKNLPESSTTSFHPEIPEFSGEHPKEWIRQAIKFFDSNPMTDRSKLKAACNCMIGPAAQWFYEEIEVDYSMNWDEFHKTLLKKFAIVPAYWPIKYLAMKNGKELSVMFVNSNKHSFLNMSTAIDLQCDLVKTPPGSVHFSAGGRRDVISNQKCMNLRWDMGNRQFESGELIVLPIPGCDIVLGYDWMSKRVVIFDDDERTVELEVGSELLVLEKAREPPDYYGNEILAQPVIYSMRVTYLPVQLELTDVLDNHKDKTAAVVPYISKDLQDEIMTNLGSIDLLRLMRVEKRLPKLFKSLQFMEQCWQKEKSTNTSAIVEFGGTQGRYGIILIGVEDNVRILPFHPRSSTWFKEEVLVIGSINGLVCGKSYQSRIITILNPLTGNGYDLPLLKVSSVRIGFGHCVGAGGTYKVLAFVKVREFEGRDKKVIFSLGVDEEWRSVVGDGVDSKSVFGPGLNVGGSLYFEAQDESLYAFDVGKEIGHCIPFPDGVTIFDEVHLDNWRGNLHLFAYGNDNLKSRIWKFDDHKWTLDYIIDQIIPPNIPHYLPVIARQRGGLLISLYRYKPCVLKMDPDTSKMGIYIDYKHHLDDFEFICTFTGSLVDDPKAQALGS